MRTSQHRRLILGALATTGLVLAACTASAKSPTPGLPEKDMAGQAAAMDQKGEAMAAPMEKKDGAMEPAVAAMESGAMMEKKEGVPDAAMMENKDGAMMDRKEGAAMQTQGGAVARKLPDQRISPHFVISSPKHGETLARAPERIQINFDFTLHESSAIAAHRDGAPVQVGVIPVNPRGLVLAANLPDGGEGLYVVGYRACWPDRSCHDGQFAFMVQP